VRRTTWLPAIGCVDISNHSLRLVSRRTKLPTRRPPLGRNRAPALTPNALRSPAPPLAPPAAAARPAPAGGGGQRAERAAGGGGGGRRARRAAVRRRPLPHPRRVSLRAGSRCAPGALRRQRAWSASRHVTLLASGGPRTSSRAAQRELRRRAARPRRPLSRNPETSNTSNPKPLNPPTPNPNPQPQPPASRRRSCRRRFRPRSTRRALTPTPRARG
jgi:hypothetical protein